MTWKKSLTVLGVLAAAVVLLYRKSMRLYWTYDDPWFLHVALVRGWTEGFTHADIWRNNLFTPLLTSTYELLVATLWLEPRRWYAAQLVLLIAVGLALYAALRLYTGTVPAAAGALLFLIGPPVVHAATTIYVIHYLEAILLAALSLIAFEKRRDALSAVLYLAAMLAKEIVLPLPFLLLVVDRGRGRRLIGHGIALVVYTIWRIAVAGVPVGYGWALAPGDLVTMPWKLLSAFVGAALLPGVVLLAIVAVVMSRALRTRRAVLIAVAGAILAVAPILPVSKQMERRFALMPWLWACAGFSFGLGAMKRSELALGAALVAGIVANRQEWTAEYTRARRMSDEAHVWVHERGDVLLRNPAIPPGTMPELEWLKEEYFRHARGARWFYDDIYLCLRPAAGRRILEYNAQSRRVEEVKVPCPAGRNDVPLTLDFEHRDDKLLWRFGPHDDGTWRLILVDGEHAWDVPRQSAYRLGTTRQIALRVGYRSPQGWVTYSPEIALDFARQSKMTWRR